MLLLRILCIVCISLAALPAGAESRVSFVLPNGMQVVLIRAGQEGTMMDLLVADVGMRNEEKPAETEYTHLMEHLMFRGSKNYPADRVREIYTRAGLYEQGFTTPDFTCYYRIFPSHELPELSRVMADKLAHLEITPEEYRAETGAVLGEYLGYYREPSAMLDAKLREVAFTVHPYRDTPDHLDALKRMPENMDRVLKFYRDFYVPGNMRLVLVGDFDPAWARRVVEETYGRLEPGSARLRQYVEPPQTALREASVEYPGETPTQLMIGYRIPAYAEDLRTSAALELLQRAWFVDGGPLEASLEDSVAEFDFPRYYFGRDESLFVTRLKLKDGVSPDAVRERFFDFVARLGREPMPLGDLEKVRRETRLRLAGAQDSLNDLAFTYMAPYFLDPRPDAFDRWLEAFGRLTPEDVSGVAARVLRPERCTVVTLTGKES